MIRLQAHIEPHGQRGGARYNNSMDRVELSLEPPFFLVAMPQVLDPFFRRTVVMVLEHHGEGSFGYIINRRTDFTLAELLQGLDIKWAGAEDATGWFGGPVQPQMGTALFELPAPSPSEDLIHVVEGLHLTADVGIIRDLAGSPPTRFRLILGYSGWGAGQLDEEMNRNDWLIAPFDAGIVFSEEPDQAWKEALASIDVRPELLPAWTASDPASSN